MLDRGTAVHHDGETGVVGDPSRFPVDDAELEPERLRADLDRLTSMRHDELGPAEHVDDLDGSGRVDRLAKRAKRRHAEDVALLRVHRDEVVPLVEEVAKDAERGAPGVRRGADDRDPTRPAEQLARRVTVEDRDRPKALLQVEVRDRSRPLSGAPARTLRVDTRKVGVVVQVADSRSYGRPSAAGGMLRPTMPARITIVTI